MIRSQKGNFSLKVLAVGLFVLGLIISLVVGSTKVIKQRTGVAVVQSNLSFETVQLKQQIVVKPGFFPSTYYYYPYVIRICGGDQNGDLVGLVQSYSNQQPLDLCIINPARNIVTKIAKPEQGFQIADAGMDNRWVVWVEYTDSLWRMYAVDRIAKTEELIDQGSYFPYSGTDYPSLSIYNGLLVYNTELPADEMVSRIIMQNLETGERQTIAETKGNYQILGPPKIYEQYVVWHRSDTNVLNSEVYLYNIKNNTIRRLSTGNPAALPDVFGNYVVWLTSDKKTPENKNVAIYNLQTGSYSLLTDATGPIAYYSPTIANGVVTWYSNDPQHNQPQLYFTATNRIRTIDYQTPWIFVQGSWLGWITNENPGIWGLSLFSLNSLR